MPKTVLALAPHPDDAEFFAGGTLAAFADEGARLVLLIATDGCRGSYDLDAASLRALRREEAQRAAAVLGAEPPLFLDHPDFELERLAPGLLREQFVRAIRRVRPDVLVAQDPLVPDEMHPDHRAVAWAAAEAVTFASLPLLHPEHRAEGLEPHFVLEKLFYRPRAEGANTIRDISATLERKQAALAEHSSQVTFLVEGVLREARAAGLNLAAVLGEAANDPAAALAWAVQAEAAQIGAAGGVAFGEAFRAVRFHPLIESLLAAQAG